VICCRVTPQQKALVVKLVKDDEHMALAIGDGGNDVSMIQEAHIGVGIAGREGLQAARAADYQIGKFRFLKRLMLIHGRYSYLRTSFIAQFSFYKSMAVAAMQLFYAFQTSFSGTSFFNTYAITSYNILFTGVQIFTFAMDKDVSEEGVFTHPRLYDDGRFGRMLNVRTFLPWIAKAWFHAIILFSFNLFTYQASWGDRYDGSAMDYLSLSTPAYTALIFVVQITLAYETHLFTKIHHGLYWGILLFYFLVSLMYSNMSGFEFYKVFDRLLYDGSFWLYIIISIVVCITPMVSVKYYGLNHLPTESEKVMIGEHLAREGKRQVVSVVEKDVEAPFTFDKKRY